MSNSSGNSNGKNGKRITKHHIIPRSRGGAELQDNIVRLPCFSHDSFHTFFGNLIPSEAKLFIDLVFLGKGLKHRKKKWTHSELYELQLKIQKETIKQEKKEAQQRNKIRRKKKRKGESV